MKLFILVVLNYFQFSTLPAQPINTTISYTTTIDDAPANVIFYSQNKKLCIADFKSKEDDNSNAVAITSSGFAFKYGFHSSPVSTTLNIKVYCNFDKNESWMKASGKNSYVLSHEQLHFDISYLSTLRFIEKLKTLNFTVSNYTKLLEKNFESSRKEMELMQHKYDKETNNGQLKDKQLQWVEKIGLAIKNESVK